MYLHYVNLLAMTPQPNEIRRRLYDSNTDIDNIPTEEREVVDQYLDNRNKTNINASTICWMILGIMVFTFTDFANVVVNDARVDSAYLKLGGIFFVVNFIIGIYFVVYLSYIRGYRNWTDHAHPALIPVATFCGCMGLIFFTIAFWPVWGILTIPILFSLFMGMFMLISLSPF